MKTALILAVAAILPLIFVQQAANAQVIAGPNIEGPNASDCMPYYDKAITALNSQWISRLYESYYLNQYLKHVSCQDSTGNYPYYYGYSVVQNATYMLPKVVYAYDTPTWLASDLIHESCHMRQYQQGRQNWGYNAEMECENIQLGVLQAMQAPQGEIDWVKSLIASQSTNWWS